MKVFVTTSNYFALVDLETSKVVKLHESRKLYWGCTFDQERIYVVSWLRKEGLYLYDMLHVFDRKTHQEIVDQERPLSTMRSHGILAWAPGRLLIADTGRDRLVDVRVHELGRPHERQTSRTWQCPPTMRVPNPDYPAGTRHINYVTTTEGRVVCVLHDGGPSKLWEPGAGEPTPMLSEVREVHDVCLNETTYAVCSSGTGELLIGPRDDGRAQRRLEVGAYPRGLALTKGCAVVGISATGPRDVRHRGSAHLAVLTPKGGWHVRKRVNLPGAGQIHQVRFADVRDEAHPHWGSPYHPFNENPP